MILVQPDTLPPMKEFHEGIKYIVIPDWAKDLSNNLGKTYYSEIDETDKRIPSRIVSNYDNKNRKILINYTYDFFHNMVDLFGTILAEHKIDPNTLFLIHLSPRNTHFFRENYNSFIFDFFSRHNIKYELLSNKPNAVIKISNFYVYNTKIPVTVPAILALEDVAESIESDNNPTKKTYVSRQKRQLPRSERDLFGDQPSDGFMFKDDDRIDDENVIEDFFESLGFEIIYPEDFPNFKKQVEYFKTVKVLAGLTGAALVNSSFMPKDGYLLELATPLVNHGSEALHHFYKEISFAKRHTYISIQNLRESSAVINNIKNDKFLMSLLTEEGIDKCF